MTIVPSPASAPAIRWGILGAGWIAERFADAVNNSTASTIVATGSRSLERAEAFAADNLGGTAYGSYEELVADPNVDAIYVATPHSHHREHALLAINAGKHVLLEKAFTRNVGEAREVIAAAEAKGVFLMEAMWTRFLPHIAEIRERIAAGEIGEVVSIQADHGQYFPFNPQSRLFDPNLAGGALLDLGVYPIAFAHDFLGKPDSVTAVGQLTETGVDGQISIVFNYAQAQATLHTTLWSSTPTAAVISGTEGRIEVDGLFYCPTSYRVIRRDGSVSEVHSNIRNGYAYEAAEVARRITAGDKQSDVLPHQHTLEIMEIMDDIRAQVGVVYPGE